MFVENNSRTNWCPTPGCPALFELENNQETYKCPSCKNSYCLRCRTESHKGLTCAQVREMNNLPPEDKNFMMFARGAHYKQCPSCSFWVEKSDGCDHMTCRCKYEFCYKCGGKHGDCYCWYSNFMFYHQFLSLFHIFAKYSRSKCISESWEKQGLWNLSNNLIPSKMWVGNLYPGKLLKNESQQEVKW